MCGHTMAECLITTPTVLLLQARRELATISGLAWPSLQSLAWLLSLAGDGMASHDPAAATSCSAAGSSAAQAHARPGQPAATAVGPGPGAGAGGSGGQGKAGPDDDGQRVSLSTVAATTGGTSFSAPWWDRAPAPGAGQAAPADAAHDDDGRSSADGLEELFTNLERNRQMWTLALEGACSGGVGFRALAPSVLPRSVLEPCAW